MKHQESKLQQACVRWFRYEYPQFRGLLFAIPNGGRRSKIEAGIMSAEGVTPGIPDLQLAVPRGGYHGKFIEMKIKGNGNSEKQSDIQKRLAEQGYHVSVCYSVEQFIQQVNEYINATVTGIPGTRRP